MLPSDSHQLVIALVALISVATSLLSLWLTRLQAGRVEQVAQKIDQSAKDSAPPPLPMPPPGGIHNNIPSLPDAHNPLDDKGGH